MKKLLSTLFVLCIAMSCCGGTRQLIDSDWDFSANGGDWQKVDLPHDWSIECDFDQNASSMNDGGYVATGTGVYKKTINIPKVTPNKIYKLYFEGVYMNSDVYVNGMRVGGHPYGYSSFWCNITPALKDGENVIEVKVDNSNQRNCRWYTGSGIYRHVYLCESGKTNVAPWSIKTNTEKASADSAMVNVDFGLVNLLDEPEEAIYNVSLIDADGRVVSTKRGYAYLNPNSFTNNVVDLSVSAPMLWDIDNPYLYTLKIETKALTGTPLDEIEQTIGIRTIDFSTDGFKLNGKPVLINGACVHHDNGILGSASFDAAEWRKAKLLKDAGFNAVRCSHNVPAPAFLDACDRLGLLVIDEAFDGWRDSKTEHDYSELIDSCWTQDISAMVLRDRNHPSIIAWSIGNEVIERKKLEVVTTAHKLANLCHTLDPSRPVTSALAAWDEDWEIYDPLAAELGVTGYNYMIHKAESDHKRVPTRIMWQTESFPRDAFRNWETAEKHPYILGDFVWTGLDYLGESGIGRHYYEGQVPGEHWERPIWPWHGALCGDVDITGQRKPISYYRDFLYNRDMDIYMAVREPNGYRGQVKETLWGTWPTIESWNWTGWEGKPIEVEVISSAPSVRLYLNDELVAEQPTNRENGWRTIFTLPYQPGTLRAEAVGADASTIIATTGAPASIRLTPDREHYAADGQDIAFVIVELVDSKGRVVRDADREVEFKVSGPGVLKATGTADMTDEVKYTSPIRRTHQGRAIVAVRTSDDPGKIKLEAKSQKLRSSVTLNSK